MRIIAIDIVRNCQQVIGNKFGGLLQNFGKTTFTNKTK